MADKRKNSIKGLGHDVINALVQKVEKKKKKRESKRSGIENKIIRLI